VGMHPPTPANACVLWLHGADETGASWERLEADPMSGLRLRLPWVQWAFPTAKDGEWFAHELPVIEAATEFAGIDDAVATVHAMLRQVEEGGIQPARILLGGFGPGAALALLAGRTYLHRLAGIVGLSGWYMRPRNPSTAEGLCTPVLLCHGEDDDEVPVELFAEACARLERDGVELSRFSYAGLGHHACATELTVLAAPKNFITMHLPTLTPAPPRPRGEPRPSARESHGDVPRCKLDEGDEMALEALAEELMRAPEQSHADDPLRAPARDLVASAEAAQREATACQLVELTEDEGALRVRLALDGVSSLAEAELHVSTGTLQLRLPGARKPFVLPLPRTIDPGGADKARFVKKSGMLTLTLPFACEPAADGH